MPRSQICALRQTSGYNTWRLLGINIHRKGFSNWIPDIIFKTQDSGLKIGPNQINLLYAANISNKENTNLFTTPKILKITQVISTGKVRFFSIQHMKSKNRQNPSQQPLSKSGNVLGKNQHKQHYVLSKLCGKTFSRFFSRDYHNCFI